MNSEAPKRLLESIAESGDGASLRALLESGRDELPDASQIDALALRLGPILGPGGGGPPGDGGGGGPTGASGAAIAKSSAVKALIAASPAAKLASVVGVGLAVAIGGASVMRARAPSPVPAPVASVASSEVAIALPVRPRESVAPEVREVDPPPPSVAKIVVSAAPQTSASSERRDVEPPPVPSSLVTSQPDKVEAQETEAKALQRALDAVRSNPAEALAICNQSARIYPRGVLGQEREVIAIEALSHLGRTDEANRRAEQYVKAFPKASRVRLETLLGRKF